MGEKTLDLGGGRRYCAGGNQPLTKAYAVHSFTWASATEHGRGVDPGINNAFAYYLEAAHSGFPEAQYNVGFSYREGLSVAQDYQKAAEWFEKPARNGEAGGQRELAYCYFYGQGVLKDERKEVDLYCKAAKANDSKAQDNLALCYMNGEGVRQSQKWAAY